MPRHRGAIHLERCHACQQISKAAYFKLYDFRQMHITAREWSQWRISMFAEGFGPAVARGEQQLGPRMWSQYWF